MPTPQGESYLIDTATHELREILKAQPGSLAELGARLGVHKSTVGRIMAGTATPSMQLVEKILDDLGYTYELVIKER